MGTAGPATVAMEQETILHQPPLQLHDYPLSSEHDYHDHHDQFSSHAANARHQHQHQHHHQHHQHQQQQQQQQSYTAGGAVDLRRDAAAVQPPASFAFTAAANGADGVRFGPDRGVAPEGSNYQASTSNFTDSSSGSISTSPSSAASSLYTNYPQNHCTSVPSFPAPVQLPQSFVPCLPAPYASSRIPALDSATSGMLPPPIRWPISSSANATDCEAYAAHSTSFVPRSQLSPASPSGYASYSDTPRNALSLTSLSLSNPSAGHYPTASHGHMASPGYGQVSDCGNFPWPTLEIHAEMTCADQAVTPEVHAKVEKGFFRSTVDQKWTCYRRNYFSVQCNFELHPHLANGRLMLKKGNSITSEPIQAMGMRLAAAVDGGTGKSVELVQHTPKRDNGPKNKIDVVKVSPMPSGSAHDRTITPAGMYQVPMSTFHSTGQVPGPLLPLQNISDHEGSSANSQAAQVNSSYPYAASATHLPLPGANTAHTFERVQFKQATANNGKRRASQQYFHLIVELFADVRKEGSDNPTWVKVAHRVSEKIVVRGRSPSHYQNEGQNQNGRAGSSGGSGNYSAGGASYSSMSTGGFRSSSNGYIGGLGHGLATYRSNANAFQASPEHSGSSASSVDGGAQDVDYPGDVVMSDAERNDMQAHEGYRYYPGPLYESVAPGGALPLPKMESTARYPTDPATWAIKSEYGDAMPGAQWSAGGMSRFQGVESSRGYFPELVSNYS